jgi:hypothetical protein
LPVTKAPAENAGLTVLHYDADYERIAELTCQAQRWIVPRQRGLRYTH